MIATAELLTGPGTIPAGATTADPGDSTAGTAGSALLRVPLFYKILLANSVLGFVIAAGSTATSVELLHAGSWRTAFGSFLTIAVISALVTTPFYALILRLALAPVELLARTAERVEQGELGARAVVSALADPELTRLTRVFNRLVGRVEADRQRLQAIAARAFNAQEAERTRLARELHEETAQRLSGLMLQLRVARRTPEGRSRDALLDAMRVELAAVTERIRGFAGALQPPALADLGLVAALEGFARGLPEDGPGIVVLADDISGILSAEGALAAYRIAQEAIINAVRHADAREVRVRVSRSANGALVTIEDDGRGFVVDDEERAAPCLGLVGMRERALYAGGSIEISSSPGAGTRVAFRIPGGGISNH